MTPPGEPSRGATDSTAADQFGWLLSRFTGTTGVLQTVAVASDGRLLAKAEGLACIDARRLAVVTISVANLADAAGHACDAGAPKRVVVDLDRGYLVINAVNADCLLGVVARGADLARLTDDIDALVSQVASAITADFVEQLAAAFAAVPAT